MSSTVPSSHPIAQALDRSEPLARLAERLRESRQRLEAIAPLLPQTMRSLVRPGPIDAEGWTLLADNGAIAAKLRHMAPALQAHLTSEGWTPLAVRVRILALD